jgi:hypothetical protein
VLTSLLALTLLASPSEPCVSKGPKSAVEAFVELSAPRPRDTVVTAVVCLSVRANAKKVGSYHGELYFDSTAARVIRVESPADGMRVDNAGKAGQVNFAGAAPGGFAAGSLLRVQLRVKPAGRRPTVRLRILELNSTDGDSLLKGLVISSARVR